jgi:hypothetical protein
MCENVPSVQSTHRIKGKPRAVVGHCTIYMDTYNMHPYISPSSNSFDNEKLWGLSINSPWTTFITCTICYGCQ